MFLETMGIVYLLGISIFMFISYLIDREQLHGSTHYFDPLGHCFFIIAAFLWTLLLILAIIFKIMYDYTHSYVTPVLVYGLALGCFVSFFIWIAYFYLQRTHRTE